MNLKPIILTFFGLFLAGGSVLLAEVFLNPSNNMVSATQEQAPQTVTLIAAATDIPFGAEITANMLKPVEWPIDAVPANAYDNAYILLGPDGTEPRRATQAFDANSLIMSDHVSNFGASRVDIVLTQGRGDTLRTGTILQDIRVLGIDQNADESSRSAQEARTITVEVTPRGSQILALSQQAGILSLTLRNGEDDSADSALEQITLNDVWGIAEALPEPVVQPAIEETTVRVRRGTQEQDVVVD